MPKSDTLLGELNSDQGQWASFVMRSLVVATASISGFPTLQMMIQS